MTATAATISMRMEWVVVCRNETASSMTRNNENHEEISTLSSRWNFKRVFHDESVDSATAELSKRTTSQHNGCYYNRSDGRVGWRIFDTVDQRSKAASDNLNSSSSSTAVTDGNDQIVNHTASKKRKRTDPLWKLHYFDVAIDGDKMQKVVTDVEETHAEQNIATTMVDPRQLIPIYNREATNNLQREKNTIPILITDTTEIYRLLAASQIHCRTNSNNDIAVLEIGSSTGMTSEVVWEQLQRYIGHRRPRWVGLDTGADMVTVVQKKLKMKQNAYSNGNGYGEWASCHHIDPLLDPDTASLLVKKHMTKNDVPVGTTTATQLTVLIDIGGNREEGAVLRMLDWVICTFQSNIGASSDQCRVYQIIIKSESIYSTLSNIGKCNLDGTLVTKATSNKDWYISRLSVALRDSLPKHPLQAPKRFLPTTTCQRSDNNLDDDGIKSNDPQLICRYHNYHKAGCAKKIIDGISLCPYDHNHCHVCLTYGHIARNCPLIFG